MKKLVKLILLLMIVGVVAAVVASVVSKKKLAHMSDEDIRAFLASKLADKVGEEQLASIQDAVIAGVRGGRSPVAPAENLVEEVDEAVEELEELAADVAPESAEDAVIEAVDES